MNFINKLESIKSLCRVCLTQSQNMIPLSAPLEKFKETPLIEEALQQVVGNKIELDIEYPEFICSKCLSFLKVSYNFKIKFSNSEKMLVQHFSDSSIEPLLSNEPDLKLPEEPSPVELIVGSNKFDLKDILIVEEEKTDPEDFKGFLDNLGKTISAKFVKKSKNDQRNLQEEEPVVQIKKMENERDIKKKTKLVTELLDQCIIENTEESVRNDLKKLGIENLNNENQEIFQCALNMKLKCKFCDKIYSSRAGLKRHLKSCESELFGFGFKCHQCSKIFRQKKLFNYHVKTVHSTDPLKYKCETCNQVASSKSVLMYHKLTKHGERKFVCEICKNKFFTSNALKRHILSHTGEKIPQCICPVCGKTFHYKGGLFYHMKLHTNERKYCCEFCDKKFYTIYAKKRHSLTHTGNRPYPCKYCTKQFCSTGELRKHEYIHNGLRPYSCQYCKKRFTSSYNMKLHLFSHPGPYVCKTCDRSFVNMNVLQYHHKMKHPVFSE